MVVPKIILTFQAFLNACFAIYISIIVYCFVCIFILIFTTPNKNIMQANKNEEYSTKKAILIIALSAFFFYNLPVLFFIFWAYLLLNILQHNYNFSFGVIGVAYSFSKINKQKLLNLFLLDSYKLTNKNLYKYAIIFFKNQIFQFKNLLLLSWTDLKVAFTDYEPIRDIHKEEQELRDMFRTHFLFVDFLKVNSYEFKTDAEFEKLKKFWQLARDPRLNFNKVSHMPIKYTFKLESDGMSRTISNNSQVLYNFFKTTIIALLCTLLYFIYTIFFFKIQFLKQLSVWFVIGMLFFWLMSGFNFFIKRYQFGKFTAQIQRFWKRTNTSFWLIEGFLILLFFYYFLNSSQEPVYMYDYSSLNQEYLISLQTIFMNVVLLSLVIYFLYFIMLRINSNSWQQLSLYLMIVSIFIFFSFFLETYQFYYVISTFNERTWVFSEEDNLWSIDVDSPILRTKQNYLLVCLIAKYWHFLFIFLSWVFFLIKSLEKKKITYVLFGANLQNIIILYVLNFACYVQWFKWVYRRFFDLPYTWFMTNIDNKFFFRFYSEMSLLTLNLFNFNTKLTSFSSTVYKSLALWDVDSLVLWKFL